MVCNIYDSSLNKIGIFSSFSSLVWTESYTESGLLQIVMPKSARAIELLREEHFVGIPESDTLMFIDSTEDKDGQIWAYGTESKYLLDSRIYDGTLNLSGNIESTLRTAVNAKRPYPFLGLAESSGLTAQARSQATYKSLFEISQTWCETAGYGFKLIHDKANKKLLYSVYNGQERAGIKFAEKYGNLSNLARTLSEKGFRNVAYVGGQGEGSARTFVTVGATAESGLARREMFVDAKDIQKEDKQTDNDYIALLAARGLEKLNEANKTMEISFDISSKDFGKSFYLGDKITCLLPEYGMYVTVRIAEATRTYENNILTTTLTLGNPVIRGA